MSHLTQLPKHPILNPEPMLDPQNSADADPTWAVITGVTSGVTMIMTHIGALIAPPITTDEPPSKP